MFSVMLLVAFDRKKVSRKTKKRETKLSEPSKPKHPHGRRLPKHREALYYRKTALFASSPVSYLVGFSDPGLLISDHISCTTRHSSSTQTFLPVRRSLSISLATQNQTKFSIYFSHFPALSCPDAGFLFSFWVLLFRCSVSGLILLSLTSADAPGWSAIHKQQTDLGKPSK